MKTSKKIFITLVGTIAILILAALLYVKISGRSGNENPQSDFKIKKINVSFFKVLLVKNCMNITIKRDDSTFIEVTYPKDSILRVPEYKVNEDTLMISDFEKRTHHNISIIFHVADSLKKIVLRNADVGVFSLGKGKLSFELDQSSLLLDCEGTGVRTFQALDISARNHSQINSSDFKVDSIHIVLQHSEADLQIKSKNIIGCLTDSSHIVARLPLDLLIKRDASCQAYINNY